MRVFGTIAVFLSLAHAVAAPADGPLSVRSEHGVRDSRLRASKEVVLINATVLDRQGSVVPDLGPDDFQLADEGGKQAIESVTLEDTPVSIVLVVDMSRSMKKAIPDVKAAIACLSASSKPADEYMLITVRGKPTVDITFSRSAKRIQEFVGSQEADGATALIDGLMLALHEAKKGRHPRRAVILLSDGYDTASRFTWSELRSLAREVSVQMYAFCLPSYGDDTFFGSIQMEKIVADTGGRYVYVAKPRHFVESFERLDVHRQYVIGYTPTERKHDGKYRRVKVSVVNHARKLTVFWRRGYFAPAF